MKFVCERCHTKYSIADEKVRGKVLKVRCKTCTNVITVRETGASVEDAPASIDAGHAPAAPVSPAVPASSPAAKAAPRAAGAAGAQVLAGAPAPTNGAAPRATRASIASPTLSALGVSGGTSASGGAMAAAVAPRRATGAIPIPPPLPIPDDVEWYLAVDGVQTGPFSRAVLLDKVMVQPKTADVHVWNADLDGWKPPRDLPELSTELMRRRRSLTPAPPPPPKRLFPTGSSPKVGTGTVDEPKGPAAIRPTALDARPHPAAQPYPGSPAQARAAAHAPASAPGIHPHPPGHTGKNGTANGAATSGFDVDQLVGGDASAAISSAALPALLPPSESAPAPLAVGSSSADGLSAGTAASIGGLASRLRSNRVLLASAAGVAVVLCGIVAYAILHRPAPAPGLVEASNKAEADKSSATSIAAVAENLAKQEAEAAAAAAAKAEAAPPTVSVPVDSKVAVAARVEAPAPRPGRRSKRGRTQPTSTVPPPVASGMTADQRDAAGRFGDSAGRELRLPAGTPSSGGARSTPVQADISRVINNNRQGIQTCYQRALLRDNSLTNGKITVRVTVGLSGRVKGVNLDATPPFRALEPCIRDVMSRWAFPPSSEEYQTEFPVVLAGNQ
jgi:predicted Zn finger-like uncharacterized protein